MVLTKYTRFAASSDLDLVRLFLGNRDQQAFECLLARYQNLIYSLIPRSFVEEDRQDILIECMGKIALGLHSFDLARAKLSTWIGAITRNEVIDRMRSAAYRNRGATDDWDEHLCNRGGADAPDREIILEDLRNSIEQVLAKMSARDRRLLRMCLFEELKPIEISEIIGLSESAVKGLIFRRIAFLRNELKKKYPTGYFCWLDSDYEALIGIEEGVSVCYSGPMLSKNPVINLYRHLWKYSKGARRKVVLFSLMELVANILMLGNAIAISRAFNNVQFSSSDPKLLTNLIFNLALLVAIIVGFWVFHGASRVMETTNAFLVRKNYKEDMISKVMSLPLGWHKRHHSGETIDKINKSGEALFSFSSGTFMINNSFVKVFGSLIAIFLFDRWATLIAATVTALAIVMVLKFDVYLRKAYLSIYKAENHLASAIHDYVTNIFSIITLRLKDRVNREVLDRSISAYPMFRKQSVANEMKWFTIGFFQVLMTFMVLSLNAYASFHDKGVIVIGTLFALFTYLQGIGSVFSNFAMQYGQIVQNDAAVRSAHVINEEYEKVSRQKSGSLPSGWKELSIRNLSFSYADEAGGEGQRLKHLDNVSFAVKNGEKIAFIGESGSGKSTSLALLRGLYLPEQVEVFCDGVKLQGGLAQVYDHTTLVPQEPELFNSTVLDNITMDTRVGDGDLDKVIDLAQFRGVLERLPKGLETRVLEKGVSLSGGEKQRLALARGLLAGWQSDFVLMDEPTSSVDFANEMRIYENVIEAFRDKTVISTVHNLSLLRYFDSVYLFEKGRLIASGSFDELMGNEDFKRLWDNYNKSLA